MAGIEIHITVDDSDIEPFNQIFPELFPGTKPIKEPIKEIAFLPLCDACKDFVPTMVVRLAGIVTVLRRRGLIDDRILG